MARCVPRALAPGDTVAVVAPASPFDRDELFRGLAWLRIRYRLRLTRSVLARAGYLAGDDATRAADLARAMIDPEVRAIVCARGGYGAMRILDALPWTRFAEHPRWIVGFSDITALHLAASAHGVCSLHAMNVTGMGRTVTAAERLSLLDALEGRVAAPWTGLETVHPGTAVRGPLHGGNLALVEAMAAAGRLAMPDGAILLLEDVTERPYRIDRMLTALRLGGVLQRAGALVFGGFTQCEPGRDGVTVADVVRACTTGLGIPVVSGAPFGHGAPNRAFTHGENAVLEGTTLSFGAR